MKKLIFLLLIINFGCKSNESLISQPNNSVHRTDLYPIKYEKLWGYSDYFGNTIMDPQFEEATLFRNGFAVVKKDNRFGYISRSGNWVIKPKYICAESFNLRHYGIKNKDGTPYNSLIAKVNEGKGDFYINPAGKPIKEVKLFNQIYDCVQINSRLDEFSIRNLDGSYELISHYLKTKNDSSGYKVTDTTQLKIDTIIEINRHFALLKKDTKYAIFSTDLSKGFDINLGERIIIPHDSIYIINPKFIYDDVKFKSINGIEKPRSIFKKGNKWGILSISGLQEIVPFIYLDIIEQENSNSYLVEFEENKFGYFSILHESNEVNKGRANSQTNYIVREHFKRDK